jgi:hypothetical protein
MARLNRLRKNSSRRKKHTSGAEAQIHFQRLKGTSKLVPLPKPALIGVSPQAEKPRPFKTKSKPEFFRSL